MDDGTRARKKLAVGRVVEGRGPLGQVGGAVALLADEEQGAYARRARRLQRFPVEPFGDVDGRRAEREDDGRLALFEKLQERRVELFSVARAVAPVVEGEA